MMKIHVHYWLSYSYGKAVSLSRHEFRILPRQQHGLQIEGLEVNCPKAESVFYRKDIFDNEFICTFFSQPIDNVDIELKFSASSVLRNPFDFLLDPRAETTPPAWTPEEMEILQPYIKREVGFSLHEELRIPKGLETVGALTALSQWHFKNIAYERREEGSARSASETFVRKSGACRDTAVLFAAVLRANGFPARLVSGFLATSSDDPNAARSANALHAWVEIYLPGAGWVGCDPTNGVLCDHHYLATAVGPTPESIAPISGAYFSKESTPATMDTRIAISVES